MLVSGIYKTKSCPLCGLRPSLRFNRIWALLVPVILWHHCVSAGTAKEVLVNQLGGGKKVPVGLC